MADKLSIEVRKFRSYEYETKNYPVEFLVSLIDVLNVNINWLLTGKGDMFNKNEGAAVVDSDFKTKVELVLKENGLLK